MSTASQKIQNSAKKTKCNKIKKDAYVCYQCLCSHCKRQYCHFFSYNRNVRVFIGTLVSSGPLRLKKPPKVRLFSDPSGKIKYLSTPVSILHTHTTPYIINITLTYPYCCMQPDLQVQFTTKLTWASLVLLYPCKVLCVGHNCYKLLQVVVVPNSLL